MRWLLRRLAIYPNAYYNYRKHRKAAYYAQKAEVQEEIRKIYHSHNGVDGYRNMKVYLEKFAPKRAVRLSMSDYRNDKGYINVPVFAAEAVMEVCGGNIIKR